MTPAVTLSPYLSFMNTLPNARIANISFLTPRLAIGGDLHWNEGIAGQQLEELLAFGVTHLVDLRIEWSDEELVARLAPTIRYHHLGIDDAGQVVPDEWFDDAVGHVLAAYEHDNAIVVSHCHMGINRGPSLGFAVLLAEGWDPIDALDHIHAARPIASVGYAEDALRWHHHRGDTPAAERRAQQRALAAWRTDHDLEIRDAIRRLRDLHD